ncbi:MAG: hypothetical protein AAFQ67_00450, partial [Pseudomonadota bacterium]
MKHLFLSAVAGAALLSGCGSKEASNEAAEIVTAVQTDFDLSAELKQITLREGDASEAPAAIAAMSLSESGAGPISFQSSSVDGASAEFGGLEIDVDEALITAASLTFDGLETDDTGAPVFSKMTLSGLKLAPKDEPGGVDIGDITLLNPSPSLAAIVAKAVSGNDLDESVSFGDLSFDAFTIDKVNVAIDDEDAKGTFDIASMALLGKTDDGLGTAMLSGLSLDLADSDGTALADMALQDLTVRGLGGPLFDVIGAALENGDLDEQAMAELAAATSNNPLEPGYDSVSLTGFVADIAGIDVSAPSLEARVERDSEGFVKKTVTEPFTMTLAADASGEAGAQLAPQLEILGYETLELSGAGEAVYDKASDIYSIDADKTYLSLKDGFDLSYGLKMEGVSQLVADINQASLEGDDADPSVMLAALQKASVHNFGLKLADKSMMERAFNLAAQMSGQEADAI